MKLHKPAFAGLGLALSVGAPALAEDCYVRVSEPWKQAKGYTAEAVAVGPSCQSAMIVLTIRGPKGNVRHTAVTSADKMAMYAEVASNDLMKKVLKIVLTSLPESLPTADNLPDWKDKAKTPESGFKAADGVERAEYLAMRKEKRPLFCYKPKDGSLDCAVLDKDGRVMVVGTQDLSK